MEGTSLTTGSDAHHGPLACGCCGSTVNAKDGAVASEAMANSNDLNICVLSYINFLIRSNYAINEEMFNISKFTIPKYAFAPRPAGTEIAGPRHHLRLRPDKHLVDLETVCEANGQPLAQGRALVYVEDVADKGW
jgi:hypothetical protein